MLVQSSILRQVHLALSVEIRRRLSISQCLREGIPQYRGRVGESHEVELCQEQPRVKQAPSLAPFCIFFIIFFCTVLQRTVLLYSLLQNSAPVFQVFSAAMLYEHQVIMLYDAPPPLHPSQYIHSICLIMRVNLVEKTCCQVSAIFRGGQNGLCWWVEFWLQQCHAIWNSSISHSVWNSSISHTVWNSSISHAISNSRFHTPSQTAAFYTPSQPAAFHTLSETAAFQHHLTQQHFTHRLKQRHVTHHL